MASTLHGRAHTAQGTRPTQEDHYLIWEGIHPQVGPLNLYAVMDGHNGPLCAEICRQHLAPTLLSHPLWRTPSPPVSTILRLVIASLESRCIIRTRESSTFSGTTICIALLVDGVLHVAHVGDSRCVIIKNGLALWSTQDHSVSQPREFQRLQVAGAVIKRNRLIGIRRTLGISRALGDRDFKDMGHAAEGNIQGVCDDEIRDATCVVPKDGLIAMPDVYVRAVAEDEVLVLGTDGVWAAEQHMRAGVAGCVGDKDAAEGVVDIITEALRVGNRDNVTAIVVRKGEEQHLEMGGDRGMPKIRGAVCSFWEASPVRLTAARRFFRAAVRLVGGGGSWKRDEENDRFSIW